MSKNKKTRKVVNRVIDRPTVNRIIFTTIVVVIVIIITYCLRLDIDVIAAIATASFWGAFNAFDKLFQLKK